MMTLMLHLSPPARETEHLPGRHGRPASSGVVAAIVTALIAGVLAGCDGSDLEERHSNGSAVAPILLGAPPDVARPEHQAVVAIRRRDYIGDSTYATFAGSGTLISPRLVLTATHCVNPSGVYEVVLGDSVHAADPASSVYPVAHVRPAKVDHIPTKSNPSGGAHDIAVLVLGARVSHVKPVPPLPPTLAIREQELGQLTVNAVGFGAQSTVPKPHTGVKRQVDMIVKRFAPQGSQAMLGYDIATKGGPLNGDSGGPSFLKRDGIVYVAGVHQGSDGTVAVDVNVAFWDDWIRKLDGVCESDADCRAPTSPCQDAVCLGGRCETQPRLQPVPAKQGACATGQLGVCSAGHWACSSGAPFCQREVEPSAEILNDLDDNCDGRVDEGNQPGCYVGDNAFDHFIDPRDGRKYYVATVGDMCWMAQDLGFSYEPNVHSWCFNGASNCAYRLYDWTAASQGSVCSPGWGVPDLADMQKLYNATWNPSPPPGTSPQAALFEWPGFAASTGGIRYTNGVYEMDASGGCCCCTRTRGALWTSTLDQATSYADALSVLVGWNFLGGGGYVTASINQYAPGMGLSIRCLKK